MTSLRTASNSSGVVHPPGFYIIGFKSLTNVNIYIIFLLFVYICTVVFNILLMYVIVSEPNLHTPKFMSVFNLAVVDVILSTSIIPSMVKVFLVKDTFIPFKLCLTQMYTYYCFAVLESYSLAVLAYDRVVAVCFPLHQNMFHTLRVMACILSVTWVYVTSTMGYYVGIVGQLSYCKSVKVFSYFCDYAPVYRLACGDYSLPQYVASVTSLVNLLLPLLFIVLSYTCILVVVFRMKSVSNRVKTLLTCIEHLILVGVFYIPLLTIFLIGFFHGAIELDRRVLSLSLSSCIPPCINPIAYSLKTKEIRGRFQLMIQRIRRKI